MVTIIAICHNHKKYVVETLDSIRNQTYSNIQCIIINNLKDDGCREVIEAWLEKHQYDALFIQNEEPLSITQNLNLGLKYTKGKYFQGIACDDILRPDKITHQVNIYSSLDQSYACVFGDMTFIDDHSCIIEGHNSFMENLQNRFPECKTDNFDFTILFSSTNPIPAPTVLMKTQAVREIGGYNENIEIEDYSINLELKKNNYKFFFDDQYLPVYYRILEGSLSVIFRKEKYIQIYKLLLEHKDHLNTDDEFYRMKLRRGVLLMPNFPSFLSELFKYNKVTLDNRVIIYIKMFWHYFAGTVKKKNIQRI